MAISLTFFLNAAINFVLGLAVAAVLGPEQFGQFALASAIALTGGTIVFDWLRLSATRLYGTKAREQEPELRATLNAVYLVGSALLAGLGLLVVAARIDLGVPATLVLALVAAGIANCHFDFWVALARARFLHGPHLLLVVMRNLLSLLLMVGAAYLFHKAWPVLAAMALSVLLAYLPVHRVLRDSHARLGLARRARILEFARYGLPLVAANVFYQLITLANRWLAAASFGYADAGHLSLATDLSTRILLAVGAGLDVYLFQLVVRQDADEGRLPAQRLVARNMLIVAAVLLPLASGFAVTMPAFDAVLVPQAYRGTFPVLSLILLPGIVAFCAVQFALAGVFTLARQTVPYAVAAGAALACDVVLLLMVPKGLGLTGVAAAHSASLVVGFATAVGLAMRTQTVWPSWRDAAVVLAATGAMVFAVWPTRSVGSSWLALACGVPVGIVVYGAVVFAFDLLGCRRTAITLLASRVAAPIRQRLASYSA